MMCSLSPEYKSTIHVTVQPPQMSRVCLLMGDAAPVTADLASACGHRAGRREKIVSRGERL